jgi:C4-dicarboxylate-binding protein DctP
MATVLGFSQTTLAAEFEIEISLETAPAHIRNTTVVELAKKIEEAAGGRLAIKVFHGSSKFRGKEEPTALAQNALDMGVTGNWYLGSVISDFNITGLPMFYGMPRDKQYAVFDGEVGQELNRKLEEKLGVKVLGRWLDLGFGSMFFTDTRVTSPEDLVGMKMRVPGGAANSARYQVLGASSVSIPFKEVAQALQRGTVDGMLSTHESVRASKFWDAGVKYAYDDYQAFYQYVPMMSSKAWNGLPADIQQIVLDAWDANIDAGRKIAAARQKSAVEEERENGIEVIVGSAEDLAKMRAKLMQEQDRLVTELRIDPALVEKAKTALGL